MLHNDIPLINTFASFIDSRIILKDTEALLVIFTKNLQPPYEAQMILEGLFSLSRDQEEKDCLVREYCFHKIIKLSNILDINNETLSRTTYESISSQGVVFDPELFENRWCDIRVISREQAKKIQEKIQEKIRKDEYKKQYSLDFYYDLLVEVGVLKATGSIEFFYRNEPAKLAAELRDESKKDVLELVEKIYYLSCYLWNSDKRLLPADLVYFYNRHQDWHKQICIDDEKYVSPGIEKLRNQHSQDNRIKIYDHWNEYRSKESFCNSVMVSQLLPISDMISQSLLSSKADRQEIELFVGFYSNDLARYVTSEEQLQVLFKAYNEGKLKIDWNSDLGKNIQFVQDYLGLCVFNYERLLQSSFKTLPLPEKPQNIVLEYLMGHSEYLRKFSIFPSVSFFARKEQKEQPEIEHKQESKRCCAIM